MSTYFVGDIHGCYKQLKLLLKKVKFNVNTDQLWTTGDLVARGPDSIKVLRFIKSLKKSAKIVLGNHDLYLIKTYFSNDYNTYSHYNESYMIKLFSVHDIDCLISWLIKQPLLRVDLNRKILLSHAGIPPQWSISSALKCAKELNFELNSSNFFNVLNLVDTNDKTIRWNNNLEKIDRLKFSINAFTRMRYCFNNGDLNMIYKDYPLSLSDIKPWFSLKNNIPNNFSIIFGHWAALQGKNTPKNFFALDTGCSWGKFLSILRWEDKKIFTQSFAI